MCSMRCLTFNKNKNNTPVPTESVSVIRPSDKDRCERNSISRAIVDVKDLPHQYPTTMPYCPSNNSSSRPRSPCDPSAPRSPWGSQNHVYWGTILAYAYAAVKADQAIPIAAVERVRRGVPAKEVSESRVSLGGLDKLEVYFATPSTS
jgi:hypothetical protein